MRSTIDLEGLGLDRGAHILLQRALNALPVGGRLTVQGRDPALKVHLPAWCRTRGHAFEAAMEAGAFEIGTVVRGSADLARWKGAVRAGSRSSIADGASASWGPAARGALVELGGPDFGFDLDEKSMVWTDLAPKLYAQAAASQWDPAAIDWASAEELPAEIEASVVQLMTYLVENEQTALAVPARFLGRIHPHFREAIQFLAVQIADEARHVEVFSRRAGLNSEELGKSTVSGRLSLFTLLSEPDFTLASFLLSVLGEGTFLNLLAFIQRYAPDAISRDISRLARQDETRHVAFAMGHLEHQLAEDTQLRGRLRASIERRYEALRGTVGLAEEVFDALVLIAAGSWQPEAIAAGYEAVALLKAEMAEGRQRRLMRLGFAESEASTLAGLHTNNFM